MLAQHAREVTGRRKLTKKPQFLIFHMAVKVVVS